VLAVAKGTRFLLPIAAAVAGAALAGSTGAVGDDVAKPKAKSCVGRKATIVVKKKANKEVVGTDKADVIFSAGKKAQIRSLGGDDVICMSGGSFATGSGDDLVLLNNKSNAVAGGTLGSGDDFLGGSGFDIQALGGSGDDSLYGGDGNDSLNGGSGDDLLDGNGGSGDACTGGDGIDVAFDCEAVFSVP